MKIMTITMAFAALATAAVAQDAQPLTRTVLHDYPYPDGFHSLMVRAVLAPHGTAAPHTHPGVEMTYVVQGKGVLRIAGKPDQLLNPGSTAVIPAGAVHSVTNTGDTPMELLNSYVAAFGQPLATPVK